MEKFNQKSVEALLMLQKVMVASGHSKCSVTAYVREIRYICAYYPELSPDLWADWHIVEYMAYLKTVHHASYSKCKMVAQSDYKDNGTTKQMWLSAEEFLRRYAGHILPRGFVKMRHYGILANANRHSRINRILQKMNLPLHPPAVDVPYQLRLLERYGIDIDRCPKCKTGRMMLTGAMFPNNRGSPLTPSFSTFLK